MPVLEESLSEKNDQSKLYTELFSTATERSPMECILNMLYHKMLKSLTEISVIILHSLSNNQWTSSLTLRIPLLLSSKLDALRSLCRIQLSWRWATALRSWIIRVLISPTKQWNMQRDLYHTCHLGSGLDEWVSVLQSLQWLQCIASYWEVMGSNPIRGSKYFCAVLINYLLRRLQLHVST